MPAFREHLDDLPRDLPLALDGLVGIGVGAQRDGRAAIGWLRQFRAQQLRRLRLGEQFGLEIQPRRKIEIAVAGAREAIDAAVLAAAIGVERLRE